MTQYRIDVVVDPTRAERGARRVEGSIARVGDTAQRTQRLIASAFAFAGVTFGTRELIRLADTYTNIQNRLGTVTESTEELAAVTERLFNLSNRTRSSFEGTAEVYARVGLAAKELGTSQAELLSFTESLNKAVILSGASAQEAKNALIQLSQGLASGALRGDELRSVLEQLPVVADVIAKGLGVTRGELRELGAEGKISAEIVLEAFRDARIELDQRFAKTVPTVGQALTVLRNNFVQLVGDVDQATGITETLATALFFLAENLDTVGRIALTAGIALGVGFAARGVVIATRAVQGLTLAIAANPIGAIAVAATVATSALIAFSDQILIGQGRLANLQDFALAVFDVLRASLDGVVQFFNDNFGFIADFSKQIFGEVELSIEGVLRAAARVVDGTVGFFIGSFDAIIAVYSQLPRTLEALFVEAFNAISFRATAFINRLINNINSIADKFNLPLVETIDAQLLDVVDAGQSLGNAASEAFAAGFEGSGAAEAALDGILERAEQRAQERIQRQQAEQAAIEAAVGDLNAAGEAATKPSEAQEAFNQLIADLRTEGELLVLNNAERQIQEGLLAAEAALKRELTEVERELVEEQLKINQAREAEAEMLEQIRGPAEDYERQMEALIRLLDQGRISTEEFAQAQRELRIEFLETQRDIASGVERGFLKAVDRMQDGATQAERIVTNGFSRMEDAIVKFAQTGKFEFGSFVESLLADVIRLFTNQAFSALLGGGGGGGGLFGNLFGGGGLGNIFGSLFGGGSSLAGVGPTPGTLITPFASGGIIDGPTFFQSGGDTGVAGEAGKEGIFPLVRKNGELGIQAAGSNSGIVVNIIDQRSSSDASPVETSESTTSDGRRQLTVMIRDTVRRGLSNGEFDGALNSRFGSQPSLTRRS